jgi:hypothetical protein
VRVKGDVLGLVSVSRIVPKKGLLHLVEAVAILRDRGQSVRVHVIGTTDQDDASREYGRALSQRTAELGLTDLIHMEGRRSEAEINDFFGRSHIFVAPYVETEAGDKDGIPTAVLEAMSSGLAVVVTDAGSITEVIEDGQEGLIVPQREPEALADAIAQLIASPEEGLRLGSNASERVRASLDASVSEGSFHEMVAALISETEAPTNAPFFDELETPEPVGHVDRSEDNSPDPHPESPSGNLLGMTTWEERQFLYRYAKNEYDGSGAIVDLGCWLGSATASLAAGLIENPDPRVTQTRVNAFDLFRWEPEMANLFGDADPVTLKAGDSFLPWFESQLGPLLARVHVVAGDLSQASWDGGAISLLFNDASKSWPLANSLWRTFYPHCLPNRSLVVEQDYAHYYTFWIHLLHWRYRDAFAQGTYVPGSTSVVFRPLQTIVFERDLDFSDFSEQDITDAFERSLGLVEPMMRPNVWAARVMLEIHRGNRPRAQELFEEAPGRGFYGLELDLVSHLLDPTQR